MYHSNKIEVIKVVEYLSNKFDIHTTYIKPFKREVKFIIIEDKSVYLNILNSKKYVKYKLLLEIKDDKKLENISRPSLLKGIKDFININS